MSEVDQVRNAFVQLWGGMGSFWGIPPATARVFAWLLSKAEPADAEDIMEGLEMSRGAASMACKELREWGLVTPEKASGSRRVLYRPTTDLEKVIRSVVQVRKRREWDPILEGLRDWVPRLDGERSAEAAIMRQRLQSLEGLVTLADSAIESFLQGGMVGQLGLKMMIKAARGGSPASEDKEKLDKTMVEDIP